MADGFSFKRPCLQAGIHVEPESLLPSSAGDHISRLPLEMLAEVLSYTSSPDILSLARTSRFFCATLVTNPASLFVWKTARKRFHPSPIPDPAPNWTESAYIAFIFDTVGCEVCARPTRRTPFSYALRARLCDSRKCHQTWMLGLKGIIPTLQADLAHAAAVQSWLPCFESTIFENTSGDIADVRLFRPTEWEAAIQEHRDSVRDSIVYSQIQQVYARKALLKPDIMRCAHKLKLWGHVVEEWRNDVRRHNRIFLERKADGENWLRQDFINTPLYTGYRKMKDALTEKITERDFKLLKDEAAEQVAQCRRVRIRRAVEETSRVNRRDLRDHWNMLKTAANCPLPPYSEFIRLDMARTLAKKNTDDYMVFQSSKESVRRELKINMATRKHIAQQISAWIQDRKTKLSQTLGYDQLALAKEAGFLQPVDRVTAWFRCTRCSRVRGGCRDDEALTFVDVCSHRCLGRTKKDRSKDAWDVECFEPDQKAIAATKELLRVSSLEERHATKMELHALGCRLLCKTCRDPIIMGFSSLIKHCKRHETMALELVTREQAVAIAGIPIQGGLAAKLTGPSKSGNKQRHLRVFGCRHCQRDSLFTFDGLRSHTKSRHNVIDLGDEDFFQKVPDSNP